MNHLKHYLGKFARGTEKYILNPWCFIGGILAASIITYFRYNDGREVFIWVGIYGVMCFFMIICLQFHEEEIRMCETYRYKRAKFLIGLIQWVDDDNAGSGKALIFTAAIPAALVVGSSALAVFKFSLISLSSITAVALIPPFIYLVVLGLAAFMAREEEDFFNAAKRYSQMESSLAFSRIAMDQISPPTGPFTIDSMDGFTAPVSMSYRVERDIDSVTGETNMGRNPASGLNISATNIAPNATPSYTVSPGRVASQAELLNMVIELNDRLARTEKAVGRLNALIDTKADLPKEEPKHKKSLVSNSISGLEVEDNEHS